jgi:hypothetical protein
MPKVWCLCGVEMQPRPDLYEWDCQDCKRTVTLEAVRMFPGLWDTPKDERKPQDDEELKNA